MSVGIQGVMNWQTWQGPFSASHTAVTEFEPGDLVAAQSVSVTPYTAIMFMPLCVDTDDNEFIDIKMIGYMASHTESGAGPGQPLFFGRLTAGDVVMSSDARPLSDGKWKEGVWRFFDTLDVTTTVWFNDNAVDFRGSAASGGSGQGSLLIPTLGYTTLMLEVLDPGGSDGLTADGGSMDQFQAMWRGVSKEGAL